MKKSILLFLALLLPALIFVFLKYAGKNEFTVPIFHDKGIATSPECMDSLVSEPTSPNGPYRINPSLMKQLKMSKEANVLVFPEKNIDVAKLRLAIEDEMGKDDIWFGNGSEIFASESQADKIRKCVLLVNKPFQSVLVDKEGRIRGYYDLAKRDEIDRLRVELKILLKRY